MLFQVTIQEIGIQSNGFFKVMDGEPNFSLRIKNATCKYVVRSKRINKTQDFTPSLCFHYLNWTRPRQSPHGFR